jgi:predicted small secreted protein
VEARRRKHPPAQRDGVSRVAPPKAANRPPQQKDDPMPRILIAAALALLTLAGCNTIKGAGEDITAGGQAVQEEAADAQSSM